MRSCSGRGRAATVAAAAMAACLALVSSAAAEQAQFAQAAPRITNGVPTGNRPTTGALLSKSGGNFAHSCTGTLIGCETFLTAAHCVCFGSTFGTCAAPSPSSYAVYLQNVGIVGVASIHVHPDYDFAVEGDVAVIRLSAPVTGVSPTPINTAGTPALGTTGEVAGFGITAGGAADNGVLREGTIQTAACSGQVPDNAHVCWQFDAPLGSAGLDSNTCNGDSGGPLFVDMGGGLVVAGITSGGLSTNCLPADVSFDSDVFVHRAFIESIGGADLGNPTCGSGSQVGDPGTEEDGLQFHFFVKSEVACRKEIAKQYRRYVTQRLALEHDCLDAVADGSLAGPCPDATTALRLAILDARIDANKIAARCPQHVIGNIGAQGACAGATDATALAACVLAAGSSAVHALLDVEYADADPVAPIADPSQRACQRSIASAMAGYTKASLQAQTKCQVQRGQQRVANCPDAKAGAALAKAEAEVVTEVLGECGDADIAALDAAGTFGASCAGTTDATALAGCQLDEHEDAVATLLALLDDPAMPTTASISVPVGAASLRVTLNGRQVSGNDLDLYLSLGTAPTATVFDFGSENGGMFEEIEVLNPAPGTWHLLVQRSAGAQTIAYQLTTTVFQP